MLSPTGKGVKKFIDTESCNFRLQAAYGQNKIDKTHLFCISANNLILMANSLRIMMEDLDIKCVPVDHTDLNCFEAILFYEKDDKEYAIALYLPFEFCDDKDFEILENWKNNGTKFLDGTGLDALRVSKNSIN